VLRKEFHAKARSRKYSIDNKEFIKDKAAKGAMQKAMYFCSGQYNFKKIVNEMQTEIVTDAVSNTETGKKEWSAPVFEIISKDVIQSGSTVGLESGDVAFES
jgi:hypothetical protein